MEYKDFTWTIGTQQTEVVAHVGQTWNGEMCIVNGEGQRYHINFDSEGGTVESSIDVDVVNLPDAQMDRNLCITGYFYDAYEGNKLGLLVAYAYERNGVVIETGPRIHFNGSEDWSPNNHHDYIDEEVSNYRIYFPNHGILGAGNGGEYTLDAEFPIFIDQDARNAYILTGDVSGCINGFQEFDEDVMDYYIYNRYQHATYKNGSPTWDGDSHGAYERILAPKGSLCLYRYAEPNVYMIKSGLVVGSYFHHNSRPAVENADPADFSDGTLIYASPFYDKYRNEMGNISGNFGLFGGIGKGSGNTNIPMFASLQDAQDYLDGNKSIEDAENYDYLINGFGENPVNPTGTEESLTENGLNMSRGVFAVDYCMSRTGLASLGGDFFSTTYLEDMKRGLELYGNNPMNSVLQCLYFPFDISSIYSISGVEFVAFGSYNHPVSGYGISKVLFNTGLKDLGSTHITPTFRNFLDYTATEIYAYLPYIGWVNLDVNKYMDTDLNIKYAVDLHSGECTAMLFSNGRLMDCYDGQIGIKQPITSEDMSAYFMAQIQGIKGATGAVTGGAINGAGVGAKGGAYGAAAGAIVGGGLGAVNAGVTLYGLAKMRPQLFSSGGYSGALGANLPQYPIIVFCIHDCEEPVNLLQTHGKPSNKSGRIQDFSGFLSVNSVNLQCGTATNDEKDEILSYLASGVII